MPELPPLSGPAIPPEQAAGVRMRTPSNQGARALAGAIQGAGDVFHEQKMRLLESQTELDVLAKESEYGQMMAEAQDNLDPSNPAGWPDAIKQASSTYLEGLGSSQLSPAAKEAIARRLGAYESRIMLSVGRDARLAQVRMLKGFFDNRQTQAIRNGDWEAARQNILDSAGSIGMTPDETDRALMDIDYQERLDIYGAEAAQGNAEFFDNEDLGLPESDRKRYKKKAQAAEARLESEDVNTITGAIAIDAIRTKDQLAKAVEASEHITPQTAKRLLKNWDNAKPLSHDEKQSILDRLHQNHDLFEAGKISREQYSKKHHEIASEVYAFGRRDGTGGLRSRVHQLDPAGWREGNLTVPEDERKVISVDKMASAWDAAGGFGKKSEMTPEEALDVSTSRELTVMAVKEWLKTEEGKNATPAEIKDKFMIEAASAMTDSAFEDTSGTSYRDKFFNMLPPLDND